MFAYLKGMVAEKTPSALVLDVGGVGYALEIPASTFERIPGKGHEARVLVHYQVREDAHRLYGFATDAERDAFRQLIGVSKVGPRVALSILSHISIAGLAGAIASGDPSRLKGIPGVGAKTAQRLTVELRGKIAPDDGVEAERPSGEGGAADIADRDAYAAMVSLGYSEAQVTRALSRVKETIETEAPVEEWIRRALQVI
ncbi:MAG: Holliday junction branch migration protein RuvA [Chitinivibrionales bacterium]|nr:Holliday junction branch migration protein RuvA [Chitinivibrionales bacterium]MBD3397100.1 Holliday junction branch migration protein RuvA [Chitinivibrionales bacterium]